MYKFFHRYSFQIFLLMILFFSGWCCSSVFVEWLSYHFTRYKTAEITENWNSKKQYHRNLRANQILSTFNLFDPLNRPIRQTKKSDFIFSSCRKHKKSSKQLIHFDVTQDDWDCLAGNMICCQLRARILPHYVRGKYVGLFLPWVSRSSPFHRMGLRSGDIVTHLNSTKLTLQAVLNVADKRHASNSSFCLTLARKKKKLSYHYTILWKR